jgi:ribosomal protein L29
VSLRRNPFVLGLVAGALLSLLAALLIQPPASDPTPAGLSAPSSSPETGAGSNPGRALETWVRHNLGHAGWLFAAVLGLYLHNLASLRAQLSHEAAMDQVVELDQLSDVWIHLFIGIGVIWTAIGMRAALQAALANPHEALGDSAGSVLQKLVDGGILLALTTTIVGGIGGYLMRLAKTLTVGRQLHARYRAAENQEVRELRQSVARIETLLAASPSARTATARVEAN